MIIIYCALVFVRAIQYNDMFHIEQVIAMWLE